MKITAREVYEKSLALINERDSEGAYQSDISDFEKNAPRIMSAILKMLMIDEASISGGSVEEGEFWEKSELSSLDCEIPLHPALAFGVFPFALAAALLFEEDRERAEFFFAEFRDAENKIVRGFVKGKRKSVTDVYSGG